MSQRTRTSLRNRLRLRWFLARRSMSYMDQYLEHTYRAYLDHSRVIHRRDGYPVYSLTTPALMSGPSAQFLARSMYRTIQNRNFPNMVSFAVNDGCNAYCEHCSFFSAVEDSSRDVLTLEQAQCVVRDAQDLGVSVINFVGGEPLMRTDLPEIVRAVDKTRSTTVLFTNGWLLEGRARELRVAGLDSVFISIDAADAETHDTFRGRRGLHARALRGIREARRHGMSTGISCSLTPEAFERGELDRIVALARKVGVHEVLVFDALPTGQYKHRVDLIDSDDDWVERVIACCRDLNGDPGNPGVVASGYVTSHRSVGCSCGTSFFYVSPYGDIMSCDFNHAVFGNVLETEMWRIWEGLSTTDGFTCAKWGGCKIKSSEFRSRETVSAGDASRPARRRPVRAGDTGD